MDAKWQKKLRGNFSSLQKQKKALLQCPLIGALFCVCALVVIMCAWQCRAPRVATCLTSKAYSSFSRATESLAPCQSLLPATSGGFCAPGHTGNSCRVRPHTHVELSNECRFNPSKTAEEKRGLCFRFCTHFLAPCFLPLWSAGLSMAEFAVSLGHSLATGWERPVRWFSLRCHKLLLWQTAYPVKSASSHWRCLPSNHCMG